MPPCLEVPYTMAGGLAAEATLGNKGIDCFLLNCWKFFFREMGDRQGVSDTCQVYSKVEGPGVDSIASKNQIIKHQSAAANYSKCCYQTVHETNALNAAPRKKWNKKNNIRDSNVVPHRSTNRTRRCLTSQSRRDAVLSSWYGRSWWKGRIARLWTKY